MLEPVLERIASLAKRNKPIELGPKEMLAARVHDSLARAGFFFSVHWSASETPRVPLTRYEGPVPAYLRAGVEKVQEEFPEARIFVNMRGDQSILSFYLQGLGREIAFATWHEEAKVLSH